MPLLVGRGVFFPSWAPVAEATGVIKLIVSGDRLQAGNPLGDDFLHLADPGQIGVRITFGLLVEDLLAIHKYFHDALAARGNGYRRIRAVGSEEFIRHPRGGSVVLSRNAVRNLYLNFPFHKFLLIW